jgi:lysophospholipase
VRAFSVAPDGYAPASVQCPSDRPAIRDASGLSPNETAWLELRRNVTVDPMITLLNNLNITDFDAEAYINKVKGNVSTLPNIALAFSGGGYRAMLNGAGALTAYDSRVAPATGGRIGGLLQASTYVAGLSGGSWLVGSVFVNNFSTVPELQSSGKGGLWDFANTLFAGPSSKGLQILDTADYYKNLVEFVDDKQDAGFDVSLTDYW